MLPSYADSVLEINLAAITNNYHILQKKIKNRECSAVLKANAYGLGALEIANRLAQAGCKKFFVATLDEAIALRSVLPESWIAVLHGIAANQEKEFVHYNLVPVLNDMSQIKRWIQHAITIQQKLPAILHIDTGICRLGLTARAALNLLTQDDIFDPLNLCYIMSHLAAADEPEHYLNRRQLKKMKAIQQLSYKTPLSLVNSSGIFLDEEYYFDLARPGMALFGLNPTPSQTNPMERVVTLHSKIIQIKNIDYKSTVGYGGTYYAQKNTQLAIISIGYADGFSRYLSNRGVCYIEGQAAPVVGRVSMDLVTLDISNIKNVNLHPGKEVEIIGPNSSVETMAHNCGTLGYEILTNLGHRFKRLYIKK